MEYTTLTSVHTFIILTISQDTEKISTNFKNYIAWAKYIYIPQEKKEKENCSTS